MSLVIVMGVSGSGKSTVGAGLAQRLGVPFIEGDRLHPPANVAKMSAGIPLTDEDRWPWLDTIGAALADARRAGQGAVASSSALKRIYRDRLRRAAGGDLRFVFLDGPRDTIAARMRARSGHYMPVELLDSQLATLERPGPDEALTLDIDRPAPELIDAAVRWLEKQDSLSARSAG